MVNHAYAPSRVLDSVRGRRIGERSMDRLRSGWARYNFRFVLVLAAAAGLWASVRVSDDPVVERKLRVEPYGQVNVGAIGFGEEREHRFQICNDSARARQLERVYVSCTCVSLSAQSILVPPNAKVELVMTLRARRVGMIDVRAVFAEVLANGRTSREDLVFLRLSAFVLLPSACIPPRLDIVTHVDVGSQKSESAFQIHEFAAKGADDPGAFVVESAPLGVEVTASGVTQAPVGTDVKRVTRRFEVRVLHDRATAGEIVLSRKTMKDPIRVPVSIRKIAPTVSPHVLVLTTLDGAFDLRRSVQVKTTSEGPLAIRVSAPRGLTVDLLETRQISDALFAVDLRLRGRASHGDDHTLLFSVGSQSDAEIVPLSLQVIRIAPNQAARAGPRRNR